MDLRDKLSEFALCYPESGIRAMFDMLPQYPDVINLCNGEPDFPTPDHIKAAAAQALTDGFTKYSPTAGIHELRDAVADKYTAQFGRTFTRENVMIAAGGTEALLMSLLTAVDPGDEVIVTDPCYPNYMAQIKLVKGVPVKVPVYEKNRFRIDSRDLERAITPRTKAIILNYPNNPLGIASTADYIEELAGVIKKHKLFVLSDEVYEALTFQGLTHCSPAQHPELQDRTLVLNSLSKTYAMTGWRVGYIVGSTEIMEKMLRLQESVISCLPEFIQQAAITALKGPQEVVGMMSGEYEKRMNILVDGLNEVPGFHGMKTEGGLCVMFNISSFGKESLDFAQELLEGARVMSVPGSAFGETGEGFVRFCFANSADNIREGVKRIKTYIGEAYG